MVTEQKKGLNKLDICSIHDRKVKRVNVIRKINKNLIALVIAVAICNLLLGSIVVGQKRSRGRRTTPSTSAQPTPTPAPQKSKEQEIYEKDIAILSNLSAEDKETVRQALDALTHTLRERDLMGYDDHFLSKPETTKTEGLIVKAAGLVPNTMFNKALSIAWRAALNSHMADFYYRMRLSDDLLKLVDLYKLDGVAGVSVGDEIHKISIHSLKLVYAEAQFAGIVSSSN